MNPIIQQIADQSPLDLVALITEAEADIITAIHKAEAEAQANDTKPKFNIAFGISIDLDARAITNKLSWTVKQSLETSHAIDDPNQPDLPVDDGGTVTISTDGMDPVILTHKDFSAIAKKLGKK